jgi:hypothetical protein
MTDKPLDGTHRVGERFGEGQWLAYQTGHAPAERVVEPLGVIGFAGSWADGSMLRRGNHPSVHDRLVGVTCGVLTIGHRHRCPEARGTPTTTVPHVKRHHLAACGIHREPDPRLVRFLLHNAAHVIGFRLRRRIITLRW